MASEDHFFCALSSAELIYIQHNESVELRREREMMELRERWVKKKAVKVTEGQTNYPRRGHIYFSTRNTQTCNNIVTIR